MKKNILFCLLVVLSVNVNAVEMSAVVEENGLYKPKRISKKTNQQIRRNVERNILDKNKFLKYKKKEEEVEKVLKNKKKFSKKKENNNVKEIDTQNSNVETIDFNKENKIVKKRRFIQQDTPMERIAIYYNQDRDYLYKELILYLVNDKQVGDLKDIDNILNSKDDYMSFYEAVVKVFYQAYYEGEYTGYLLDTMNLIYNKSYEKIRNNYIGLLLEDLYLSMGIIHPQRPIISSVSYCFILDKKMKQFACKMNLIQEICLSGDDKMCNIYKAKMKIKYKEAERYLDNSLKLVK